MELTGRLCCVSPKVNLLGGSPEAVTGCWLVTSGALWPREEHSAMRDQLFKQLCAKGDDLFPVLTQALCMHSQLFC